MPETPQQTTPPAGWYPDQNGQQRWWDGQQWGTAQPLQQPGTSAGPDLQERLRIWRRKTWFAIGAIIAGLVLSFVAGAGSLDHGPAPIPMAIALLLFWGGIIGRIWLQVVKPKR